MTHGFDLDPVLHATLRASVPADVIAWVERSLGRRIVAQRVLEGGISAAVHRLEVAGAEEVVLQRFVLPWTEHEPWLPANEVRVLDLLQDTDVPAPRLLAADLDGDHTGCPTVLMSALPGELVWRPADLDGWIDQLVASVELIHAVSVVGDFMPWEPYPPENQPPSWSRYPHAWQRAVEAFHGPRPSSEPVFLHRDFHPGNLLWSDGRVSGVVDWVSSCIGPPEEDIAHCRINLARSHGQDVADEFLARWLAASQRTSYDRYYDLVTAVSMASGPDPRLDEFVRAAAIRG